MCRRSLLIVLILILLSLTLVSCEKKKTTEPQNQCATPALSPSGGTYTDAQSVSITCATVGATIVYTTDGSDPSAHSAVYTSPIAITATTTVKTQAFKAAWIDSAIATVIYSIGITPAGQMILVQDGTFYNGTSDVTVSSFYLDKYELTQTAYLELMGVNPSTYPGVTDGPVERVSWFDAIEYCNRRSINEGLSPCYSYSTYGTIPADWPAGWNSSETNHTNVACSWTASGYRLPTEAEWEFAARGGNFTHNYSYSGSNDINMVAWYGDNSGETTHAVGTKVANELGLFDMSGNVIEWNWDIYGDYPNGGQTNPHGAVSGSNRVGRGGGWGNSSGGCDILSRSRGGATYTSSTLGLRVCRNSL